MSQVLVSPAPIPSLAMTTHIEAAEHSTPQFHLNGISSAGDGQLGVATLRERRTAARLAHLASQHHTSEYNRLKFGAAGAPVAYIPLSIQLPMHVWELKARQAKSTQKKLWWPTDFPAKVRDGYRTDLERIQHNPSHRTSTSRQQENVAPCVQAACTAEPVPSDYSPQLSKPTPAINYPPSMDLQRELSAAMSSPLSVITIPQLSPHVFPQRNLSLHAKTSESHPINISSIVPPELLPFISSHLTSTPQAPCMFELHSDLFLDRLTAHASHPPSDALCQQLMTKIPNGFVPTCSGGVDASSLARPLSHNIWSSPCSNGMSKRSSFAVNWLHFPGNQRYHIPSTSSPPFDLSSENALRPSQSSSTLSTCSTDLHISTNISLFPPYSHDRSHSAPPSLISSADVTAEVLASEIVAAPPPFLEVENVSNIPRIDCISPLISQDLRPFPNPSLPSQPVLGNMLLSSCPGKKVRLSGPVKGRGAICRDLTHDLKRIKALDVACIICCLDDDELEFLGASWPQYSEIARSVGLDVLRIPMPEGLGPVTPASLDQHLSYIIHSYTLRGVPVLVHCRGGVGRAGLIASCWILKLGLCGWLNANVDTEDRSPAERDCDIQVRKEVVTLVERVISVVRRRRSVKAIETYEQVRFLVEYVEYLEGLVH